MFRWRVELFENNLVLSTDHYEAIEFVCDSYLDNPGLLKQHIEQLNKSKSFEGLEQYCLNPKEYGYDSLDALMAGKYANAIPIMNDMERHFENFNEFVKKELLEYIDVYVLEIVQDDNEVCSVPYPFTMEKCVQEAVDYVKKDLESEKPLSPRDIGGGIVGRIHTAKAIVVNSVEASKLKKQKRNIYDCGNNRSCILCGLGKKEPILTIDSEDFSKFANWEDVVHHYLNDK